MKIHIVTVGAPKLAYAKAGWEEYIGRLQHYHQVRVTHIADKNNDADHILTAAQSGSNPYLVALTIGGPQVSSESLAQFLLAQAIQARELCFIIGGPEGLQAEVINQSHRQLGLSELTFPHDLAMLVLSEAIYRASTIGANKPYHK